MKFSQKRSILAALLAGAIVGVAASTAHAACREDLLETAQNLERTRVGVEQAAKGTPAAQCAAYRQHVSALTKVRNVFARCDTGADKAKNAAQVGTTLASFTKQMRANCKS
jgi:hypothetical protein